MIRRKGIEDEGLEAARGEQSGQSSGSIGKPGRQGQSDTQANGGNNDMSRDVIDDEEDMDSEGRTKDIVDDATMAVS